MSKKLPLEKFNEMFEYVPRLAIDLIIINEKGEVLLSKRNIPPLTGYWHFPGSFLKKDERIDECIRRILRDELGSTASFEKTFDHVDDLPDQDPRGHIVALRYRIKLNDYTFTPTEQTTEVDYFRTLPRKIGFDHHEILNQLGFS